MAIAYTNSANDNSPATTVVIDPAATANDVILFGTVADNTGATLTSWPASFSTIGGPQDTTFDSQTSFLGRKKQASGTEGPLTATFNVSFIGCTMSFSGVDNTTPEDVAVVVANQDTGANPRTLTASITPSANGCEIVAFAFGDVGSGVAVTFTFSTTAGTTGAWTKRQEITSGFYNMAAAHANQATAGAITVQVSGAASALMGMCLMLVALRPASGGGSTNGILVNGILVNGLLARGLAGD